jgi:CheY-like chemotaxis protein/anti-sigma regulatory factor (Ser/Thr protein kinase)
VLGFSEVLLERMFGDINERQEEYLRDIHSSGAHLLELINEILDLSKVEAGGMDLKYSWVDLRTLLEDSVAMLRERATAHAIELGVAVPDDVGSVYTDELRLKQVVLNLLTNAVKYTGDGGSVVVRAVRRVGEVEVTVTDSGIGVPEGDRERIFESFQQGRRGTTREEGTGLGLTLSRKLVELLGGRMWLQSEVGVGSTFFFALPARVGEGDEQGSTSEDAVLLDDVVVIEDDRASVELLTVYLGGVARNVTVAKDGPSGLEAVRRVRPAAVLLDIRLPGMDGWKVLEELKADQETRDIPVVVVSIVDERARGAALGAAAYLVKPVSRDDLMSALAGIGQEGRGS